MHLFALLVAPWLLLFSLFAPPTDFLEQQKTFPAVRQAYALKGDTVARKLAAIGLHPNEFHLLLIGFKEEEELEVWVKPARGTTYRRLLTYPICALSGHLGPKRALGDEQMPEGFYYLDRFNPASHYLLSLGLNYPNEADRRLSTAPQLGGDIFIHGGCMTIGCLPMTDAVMQELYIYAIEAHHNGQAQIPVYLFPARLTERSLASLCQDFAAGKPALAAFWANLKTGYEAFVTHKQELSFTVDARGRYVFASSSPTRQPGE